MQIRSKIVAEDLCLLIESNRWVLFFSSSPEEIGDGTLLGVGAEETLGFS